jgi:hypothetical protein
MKATFKILILIQGLSKYTLPLSVSAQSDRVQGYLLSQYFLYVLLGFSKSCNILFKILQNKLSKCFYETTN